MQTITDRKTLALNKKREISDLMGGVRTALNEIAKVEKSMFDHYGVLMLCGWRAGSYLARLKVNVGHGDWEDWVVDKLPQLGEKPETRLFNSRRHLRIWKENQNPRLLALANAIEQGKTVGKPTDLESLFTTDSRRKFLWYTIPEKERPKGNDPKFPRSVSILNMVNEYERLRHRHFSGFDLVDFAEIREEIVRYRINEFMSAVVELRGEPFEAALRELGWKS